MFWFESIEQSQNATQAVEAAPTALRKFGHAPIITKRQLQILRLIAEDKTMIQIAGELGISSRTVEFHKGRMRKRTGCSGDVGLIRFAIRGGLINA